MDAVEALLRRDGGEAVSIGIETVIDKTWDVKPEERNSYNESERSDDVWMTRGMPMLRRCAYTGWYLFLNKLINNWG